MNFNDIKNKVSKTIAQVKTKVQSKETRTTIAKIAGYASYARDVVLAPTGTTLVTAGTVLSTAGILATKAGAEVLSQCKTEKIANYGKEIKASLAQVNPLADIKNAAGDGIKAIGEKISGNAPETNPATE